MQQAYSVRLIPAERNMLWSDAHRVRRHRGNGPPVTRYTPLQIVAMVTANAKGARGPYKKRAVV